MSAFVHLRVASSFSARFGVSDPVELVAAARAGGADAAAVTDRDGLYGAVKHVAACRAAHLDPIVGVSLRVLDAGGQPAGRVTVLAHGHDGGAGWAALCRAVSAAHTHTPVGLPRAELGRLVGDAGTVLLGPDSDYGRATTALDLDQARRLLHAWRAAVPDLAVEVVDLLTEPGRPWSLPVAQRMAAYARAAGIDAVLTNAVRYADPSGAVTADVLDAARHLTDLDRGARQPNSQAWLKPPRKMAAIARRLGRGGDVPGRDLLAATAALADRCRLDPTTDLGWGRPHVPEAHVLGVTGDPHRELWARCRAGIGVQYPGASRARLAEVDRWLDHEMTVIADLGFAGYFLAVAEVTDLIRGLGIHASARGSGASSVVVHLLGISAVDPIEQRLVFERFLSPLRRTLPDIDVDVESAERHRAYRAIFARFGDRRVTLMSMQQGYRARGAVRDAGRALGLPDTQIDEVAKSLWRVSGRRLREALEEKPELADLAAAVAEDEQLDLLVDVVAGMDRLPRHISMHPCGVILGDATLLDRTPTQPAGTIGLPMSQFDKHDMDPLGLLKLDVLGVRMQSAMAHAVAEVRRTTGETIDLDRLPLTDEPTFEAIRSTHTLGMFQIESPGQRELIGKLQPTTFQDLITDISLFRPGPMAADMVRPLLNRRGGWETTRYLHPDLRDILEPTLGIVVFHEQVIDILDRMTGCGRARGDVLRRQLATDDGHAAVETFFREHATARGYTAETVDRVWDVLSGFGAFGFCRAHGAAFALTTWQSAWLKTHHPAEFLAGILEHDPGMYPKRLLLAEARRMRVPILPLDVNHSTDQYRVEVTPDGRTGIRLSLGEVAGMSGAERARAIAAAPYTSLADFRDRARPHRRTLTALAAVGALDTLYAPAPRVVTRRDLTTRVHQLTARPHRPSRVLPGQLALPLRLVDLDTLPTGGTPLGPGEQTTAELQTLGIDATGHLLDPYRDVLARLGVTPADQLIHQRNGSEVLIAGVRVATGTPPNRGAGRVVFISLDDGTGVADVAFFADAQDAIAGPELFRTRLLLVAGHTRRTGPRGISVTGNMAWDLTEIESDEQLARCRQRRPR